MNPLWTVLWAALCAMAALGPLVDPAARVAAALGLLLGWIRAGSGRRRQVTWVCGVLVGGVAAQRQAVPMRAEHAWPPGTGAVRYCVTGPVVHGTADAWVAAAGRAPARARVSGLDAVHGAGAGGHAQASWRWADDRRNPDDRGTRRAALARRAVLRVHVQRAPSPERAATPGARARARARIRTAWERGLGRAAPLWAALLLGERAEFDPRASERFRALGQFHILSLSGTHVALVAALMALLTRKHPRLRAMGVPVLVVLWAVLVGFIAALARAVGMLLWFTLARRSGRGARALDGLAAVALLELIWRPWDLLDLSWWLSYAATAGLLHAAAAGRGRGRLRQSLQISLGAQLATLPWVISAFGLTPWSASAWDLVLGPCFAALMWIGALTATPAALCPVLAPPLLAWLALATHAAGWVMRALERIAPARWGHPGLCGLGWALALATVALWLVPGLVPARRARWALTLALLAVVHAPLLDRPRARWVSLDVGQGDAGVLRVGSGDWLAIDAGGARADTDDGSRVVLPYLERRHARHATLVITHGHRDHLGGALPLLASGRVARLALARADSGAGWTVPLRDAAQAHGAALRWLSAGDTLMVGCTLVRCWWPPPRLADRPINDRSLVLSCPLGAGTLVLCGDLERFGERALAAADAAGPSPWRAPVILKVAHHGGDTSSDPLWLDRLRPSVALVSCGAGNRYGHPHPAALRRLAHSGAEIWRTDQRGALEVLARGPALWVGATRGGGRPRRIPGPKSPQGKAPPPAWGPLP